MPPCIRLVPLVAGRAPCRVAPVFAYRSICRRDGPPPAKRRCYSTELEPVPARTPQDAVPSRRLPPRRPEREPERELTDWKPNELNPVVDAAELSTYPFRTARDLARYVERPRKYRALVRDFIDDALYHPRYGYFSTQAEILDFGAGESDGLRFNELRNDVAFDNEVARKYGSLSTDVAVPGTGPEAARQIWHTPTELFKPWYARAVARYLLAEYEATFRENGDDLVIYELGAGNGTLMRGILDYLAAEAPEAYARTRYRNIEISPRLARIQRERAERGRHADKLEVCNVSIFDWTTPVASPCFFLAFEVLDNFAHDVVRYTRDYLRPLQCFVAADDRGDLVDYYEPVRDGLILRYLNLFRRTRARQATPHVSPLFERSDALRTLRSSIPLVGNLGPPIFVPTKALMFLDILRTYFPQHSLLVADFHSLPDAVKGLDGPVVQTRYKGATVPCTTYLVSPGHFDIFFPTNFALLAELYALVQSDLPFSNTGAIPPERSFFERADVVRPLQVATHRAFLQQWAEPGRTRLRDGTDVMLDYYANASFASSLNVPIAAPTRARRRWRRE